MVNWKESIEDFLPKTNKKEACLSLLLFLYKIKLKDNKMNQVKIIIFSNKLLNY